MHKTLVKEKEQYQQQSLARQRHFTKLQPIIVWLIGG